MLTKKIMKIGGSNFILIDSTILKMLGLKTNSEVSVSLEGKKIVIQPK